jgi:hypothetical protein
MGEKYHLEINAEREQVLLDSQTDVISIRDAKKRIEKELLDEKRSHMPLDESLLTARAPAVEFSSSLVRSSGYLTLPYLDEIDLQKRLKTLVKLSSLIKLLITDQHSQQATSIEQLFGIEGIFWNTPGKINTLWATEFGGIKRFLDGVLCRKRRFKENAGGLEALANRIQRFKCPQQQEKLLRFHIQMTHVLLRSLLNIAQYPDKWVWNQLKENPYRMSTLQIFIAHLSRLSDLQTELGSLSPTTFGAEAQGFLRESSEEIRKGKEELNRFIETTTPAGTRNVLNLEATESV